MVVLARHEGEGEPKPGTWKRVTGDLADIGYLAVVRCPECKLLESIARKHTVAADGKVSPSVVCPHDGCNWHVYVRLDGWEG